ncbi:MAG: glutamine amidotransferase [Myxococcales bacterium]|nr:glutamine amidotransferase [Myxococcales bacterium]
MAWLLGGQMGPEGTLQWTAPDWAVILAVVAAGTALVAASWGIRSVAARVGELTCWALALTGIVLAVAGPVWVEEEGRIEEGRSVILVDASRSMAILEEGTPRSDAVERIVGHVRRQVGEVEIFHFGDDLAVGQPESYDLPGTDLEGALDALSERVAGEQLASVVVVSDGLDRGLLRRRYLREERPHAPELPGPLTVFGVGEVTDVLDLAVRDIDTGGYAFIRAPFAITARIDGLGFAGRTVPVTLTRDGSTITQQRVTLDEQGAGTVRFEVVAEDAGRFAYAVSVPVYEGDAVPANNAMPVVVKVVRDRIRVLQVAGAPSWDVKFLRRFLKGDPSVQLVSFFILRTPRDLLTQYSDRELSLIQFPYERLFAEDLWTFDVVVFQNFDYQPYFDFRSSELLENLRRYVVDDGGALVMVGGDRSFGLGNYGGTPLAEVLPVELSSAPEDNVPDERPFRPDLTAEGGRHPVTRLVADPVENQLWWERMHTMDGTNVVASARPDAAVLLTHPTASDKAGNPLPVLTVQEVGQGRSMALTVDASWRWSLSEAAEGRGNQAYLRFWKNAIRWLMKDSTTARVTVDTPRENYAVGEDVRVVVRARDPGFAPLPGANVEVALDNEGRTSQLKGRTNPDGEAVITIPAQRSGTHRVDVAVAVDGEPVGTAQTVFAVTTRDPEVDEVAPDTAFLTWLAASTQGAFHEAGTLGEVLTDPSSARTVQEVRETALWRAPLLAILVALFSGVGWFLRRRSGLR